MHELDKVSEAGFFLNLMQERSNSAPDFQHCLSAFLSAARSALQYAFEEAKTKGAQTWYEQAMNASPVLRFFKDKRDINIHVKPLVLMQHTTLTEKVHVNISESLVLKMGHTDGTAETREIRSAAPVVVQHSSSQVEVMYLFDDWQGAEDALSLSRKYLAELKSLIEVGISAGHLSG